MTRIIDNIGRAEEFAGYVVRRPRATDSIGRTLAAAFPDNARLPEDMQRALDAIDLRTRH